MTLKTHKPTSPGTRFQVSLNRRELQQKRPEKALVTHFAQTAGRNNQGKITVRHREGGAKRLYRVIDFKSR